ncbi:MAG: hypothetical protein H7836_18360, partial [Magnetococcus sp. YQC-3]
KQLLGSLLDLTATVTIQPARRSQHSNSRENHYERLKNWASIQGIQTKEGASPLFPSNSGGRVHYLL